MRKAFMCTDLMKSPRRSPFCGTRGADDLADQPNLNSLIINIPSITLKIAVFHI